MAWAAYRFFIDEWVCLLEPTPVTYELYIHPVLTTTSLLAIPKSLKALSSVILGATRYSFFGSVLQLFMCSLSQLL